MEEKFVDVNLLLEFIQRRRMYIGVKGDDLGTRVGAKMELDKMESFINRIKISSEKI